LSTDCHEEALALSCDGEQMLGILSTPLADASCDVGVVIVVGGPQTRVGSHRQFVMLARHLAANGLAVLRFDVRGMGDSTGPLRGFEDISPDIGVAIDSLTRHVPTVRRVVLWGLCDGASASLLYLAHRSDPRVAGLCLLNPWVRSAASQARTQVKHYYRDRLRQRDFWLKLARGQVAISAIRELWQKLSQARSTPTDDSFQGRMAEAWRRFAGPTLLVLSGNDYTAREFLEYTSRHPAWVGLLQRTTVTTLHAEEADHTFSDRAQQSKLEHAVSSWLGNQFGSSRGSVE
jgi:uncharacterized protein